MSFNQLLEVQHRHCDRVHFSFSFSGNLVLLKLTANDILFSCFIFSSMLRTIFVGWSFKEDIPFLAFPTSRGRHSSANYIAIICKLEHDCQEDAEFFCVQAIRTQTVPLPFYSFSQDPREKKNNDASESVWFSRGPKNPVGFVL